MTFEHIHDASDPRLADYRDPRNVALARRHGVFIAEGRLVVQRLLSSSPFRTRSLLLTPGVCDQLAEALARLDETTTVYVAEPALIRTVVGFPFHRGCLAIGERGVEPSPDALIAPAGRRSLVLLEDLADPDNVGVVFRNARAFGVSAALLSPGTADPLYRKAIRTSAAATLCLPFARAAEWPAALGRVRESGYTLIALTPDAKAMDVAQLGTVRPVSGRVAMLVGAEGQGLSTGSRAAAELEIRIPMAPGVDSLNVATASGIALHRLLGSTLTPRADQRRSPH